LIYLVLNYNYKIPFDVDFKWKKFIFNEGDDCAWGRLIGLKSDERLSVAIKIFFTINAFAELKTITSTTIL